MYSIVSTARTTTALPQTSGATHTCTQSLSPPGLIPPHTGTHASKQDWLRKVAFVFFTLCARTSSSGSCQRTCNPLVCPKKKPGNSFLFFHFLHRYLRPFVYRNHAGTPWLFVDLCLHTPRTPSWCTRQGHSSQAHCNDM